MLTIVGLRNESVNYYFVPVKAFPSSLQTQISSNNEGAGVSQNSHGFVGARRYCGIYLLVTVVLPPVFNIYRLQRCRAKCLREISGERYTFFSSKNLYFISWNINVNIDSRLK